MIVLLNYFYYLYRTQLVSETYFNISNKQLDIKMKFIIKKKSIMKIELIVQ